MSKRKTSEDRILQISNDVSENMVQATKQELTDTIAYWQRQYDLAVQSRGTLVHGFLAIIRNEFRGVQPTPPPLITSADHKAAETIFRTKVNPPFGPSPQWLSDADLIIATARQEERAELATLRAEVVHLTEELKIARM